MKNNLTICIAGKNSIAVNGLKLLKNKYAQYNICFLPNPIDNGINNWQPSLKQWGHILGIKEVRIEELYEINNLLFISLEYSEIIKTKNFRSKNLFNIHFSMLPKYKGMFTSALPLLFGERHSGVTLHKIDDGIDTGDIVDQINFAISDDDTARDLYFKYLEKSFLLLQNNLDNLINCTYAVKEQSPVDASYFSKKYLDFKNIRIDFFKTAFEVKNQFRAFTFREFQLPKFEDWDINKAEILKDRSKFKPGTKLFENDLFIIVTTIDYNLKIYKDYQRLLWSICESGDVIEFNRVISKIYDINITTNMGMNAILIATYNGHIDIVNNLFNFGANINAKDSNGSNLLKHALHYYQRSNNSRLFKRLIDLGSDTLSRDIYGKNIQDYIIESNCNELLHYLH